MLRTPIELERTRRQAGEGPEARTRCRLVWSRRPEGLVIGIEYRRKLPADRAAPTRNAKTACSSLSSR
jgi:hypothetical protein